MVVSFSNRSYDNYIVGAVCESSCLLNVAFLPPIV